MFSHDRSPCRFCLVAGHRTRPALFVSGIDRCRACRPASRIWSDSSLSPTARASAIDPIIVASAAVAIWRACLADFPGNNPAITPIISSSLPANARRAFRLERAISVPNAGSTQPRARSSRWPGLRYVSTRRRTAPWRAFRSCDSATAKWFDPSPRRTPR